MGLIYLLPIVIPVTVIVPVILMMLLKFMIEKRVDGEDYKKEMVAMIVLFVSYVVFLKIFYF